MKLFRAPVVLAHHGVAEVDDASDPNTLVVSPKNLESQIRWLQRSGYTFATAEQLDPAIPPAPRTAVLTFDDGWRDGLTTVLPMLKRSGIRATFYVCPGLWGTQHRDVKGEAGRLLSRAETAELHAEGMELGSHTMTHPDLRRLSEDELRTELERSKVAIEELTGEPCRTFAYPFGLFAEREMAAVEAAGYDLAFAWLPGPWRPHAAPRLPAPPRHGALRLALKMAGIRRRVVLS
ncbi:MAG: polysaccharide deacetylase family protein [Actinomycetota bacterium]